MTIRRFPRSRQSALPYPATLDLSFLGRDTLDPRITFTRADATTCATRFNASGVLETVAANVPRFDYNPSTLAARGLLIEEQRQNLLLQSGWAGAAGGSPGTAPTSWTMGFGTGANTTLVNSIYGTSEQAIKFDADATERIMYQQAVNVTSGVQYALSVFIEAVSGTIGDALAVVNGTTSATQNTFVTSPSAPGRYTALFTANGTGTVTVRCGIGTTAAIGVTSSVTMSRPQVEAGAFPTSYIPTSSAAVTRAADAASIATLVPWFNTSSGTLFAEFSAPASGIRTMVDLNDTTATESIRLRTDGTNPFFTVTDSTDQANIDAGTVASNTVYRFAGAYAANDFATCINGGTVQTHTSGTLPTITQMLLGAGASGNALNGHLRRLAFYPTRLSNTDLQAITA